MKKIFITLFLFATCFLGLTGCMSRNAYVEGTSISLGAYIPMDGNLYGMNIISYLNGVKVSCSTNHCMEITRNTHIQNNWLFGMMTSSETNST